MNAPLKVLMKAPIKATMKAPMKAHIKAPMKKVGSKCKHLTIHLLRHTDKLSSSSVCFY